MPKKALLLSQLTLKEPDFNPANSSPAAAPSGAEATNQTKSSHEVFPATWIDSETNQPVKGFFKRVTTPSDSEDNYPILLAKYDVAISVFMRMWLGETAAEDMLVFNDQDGLIAGTFSRSLPDYKPMASYEKPVAADEPDPEIVNPTTVETLLEHNVARLLTAQWAIGNPDVHPYNISIKGSGSVLDYDECLPQRTLIIKGGDSLIKWLEAKLLNKPQRLVEDDLNTFPILSKGHERKHWPTQWIPGNLNIDKQFQSYETFRKLATTSHVRMKLKSGIDISFQEQMFESLLTMLLTYDPIMLHARLFDYFGDLPLDFMTLPEIKRAALNASDPILFNERTDQTSFVQHMLNEFQQQYDELYRAVVFYKGFTLSDGISAPVVSFIDFLRNRPSARKKSIAWAKEQNELFSFSEATRFNPEKMEDRYAQVWRDAHLIQFWVVWHKLKDLVMKVAEHLHIEPKFDFPDPSLQINEAITATGQVIKSLVDLLRGVDIDVDTDPDSQVTKGFKLLIDFMVKFTQASEKYFNSSSKMLNLEANEEYCEQLLTLPKQYYAQIRKHWSSTDWFKNFSKLVRDIETLHGHLRLDLHRYSDDDELNAPVKLDYAALLNRSHLDLEVVKTFINVLFEWANKTPRDQLIWHITRIKDEYEKPLLTLKVPALLSANAEMKIHNPLKCRYRGPEISAYLKELENREDVSGENVLAYVLSTGKCTSTSLNTNIIMNLLPIVLRWRHSFGGIDNVNLMSLDNALSGNAVNYVHYTEKLMEYVHNAEQFTHIYSQLSQMNFNRAIYRWVNSIERERFISIVHRALNEYEPENKPDATYWAMTYGFFRAKARSVAHATLGGNESRRIIVLSYLQREKLSNAGILGSIFKEGGVDEPAMVAGVSMTSKPLNVCLFDLIFEEMKHDLSINLKDMKTNPDFAILTKLDALSSKNYLHFASFKECAKQYSEQEQQQDQEEEALSEWVDLAASM